MASRRRNVKRSSDFVTRDELDELRTQIDRLAASFKLPPWLALRGVPGIGSEDDSYGYRFIGESQTVETITDGDAPASSPAPTVAGGPRYLAITWTGVANADLVRYEVHVGTSSGFTPGGSTLAAETGATIVYVRAVNGSDLLYDTDYYVKLVAKDDDGSAAASAAAGPERLDPNGTDDFLAGSVTAETLASSIALIGRLVAGQEGACRVELGVTEDGDVGIYAFDTDGITKTFYVEAESGLVFVSGRFAFGAASSLEDDVVELFEQQSGGFQPTALRQVSTSGFGAAVSSVTSSWNIPTRIGSLLLAVVVTSDNDSGAATHSTPAGWTLVKSDVKTVGTESVRGSLYKIQNAPSDSGAQVFNFGSTADVGSARMFEVVGAEIEDSGNTASNTGNDSSPTVSTPGSLAQTDNFTIALVANRSDATFLNDFPETRDSPSDDGFSPLASQAAESTGGHFWRAVYKNVTDGAAQTYDDSIYGDNGILTDSEWVAIVANFKAKAADVEPPNPGFTKLYALDTDEGPGNAYLHTMTQDGAPQMICLGTGGELWLWDHITATINLGSLAAGAAATTDVTVTGVRAGDLVMFLDTEAVTHRGFIVRAAPIAPSDNTVTLRLFNAGATLDPLSDTYHFLVIHRSSV